MNKDLLFNVYCHITETQYNEPWEIYIQIPLCMPILKNLISYCMNTYKMYTLIEIECSMRYPDKYQLERFRDNPGDKSKHGARSRKRFISYWFSLAATRELLVLNAHTHVLSQYKAAINFPQIMLYFKPKNNVEMRKRHGEICPFENSRFLDALASLAFKLSLSK